MKEERRIDPDNVDTMLAAELNQMTVQEREKVCEELHGVEKLTPETDELLETSLTAMDIALQRVPNRAIYDKAKLINASYVEDRSFHLMFLRSEYYNAERAAIRLMKFLENKVKYFGEKTLARPIYLSDLNDDDMAVLRSGIVQQIPARDRSGRVILSDFNMDPKSMEQPKEIDNYIKTVIYMVLAAAEDEETQKRGLIGIFYFTNALPIIRKLYDRRPRLFDWLPIKFVGAHFCYDDGRYRIVQALLLLMMGRERRVRVRMHQGSHTECQYKLMTFGVPVSHFPVGYEGDLKTTAHLKWVARRLVKDTALQQSLGTFEGIDLPRSNDVLLGRGKTIQDHSGNVVLRSLIADYMPEYKSAAKKEKVNVAWKVVMASKMLGGRFLKREQTNGWWMEVSDEIAREKVSMTYRTSRPGPSPRSNITTTTSTTRTTTTGGGVPTTMMITSNDPPHIQYASDDASSSNNFLEPPLKRCRKQEVEGSEQEHV